MGSEPTYRHLTSLAKGGMGEVSLSVREVGPYRRLVALKRLRGDLQTTEDIRAMFIDEARIAGMIRHPNVVPVIDVGEDAAGPFLVMDYVEGVAVSAIVRFLTRQQARIPVQVAVRIGADAARGLHAAHELRDYHGKNVELVHRDVSPQNLLVAFSGLTLVTDFGIARAVGRETRTSTGVLKGKLSYMAPEVLRVTVPGPAADIFSLGVVLYELLTSERLYPARHGVEVVAQQILEGPIPDLGAVREDAPPGLVELLFEMLAKAPAERPPSAREVAVRLDAIARALAAEEGVASVEAYLAEEFALERARVQALAAKVDDAADSARSPRRHRGRWFAGAAAAACLVLALGWGIGHMLAASDSNDGTTSTNDEVVVESSGEPAIEVESVSAAELSVGELSVGELEAEDLDEADAPAGDEPPEVVEVSGPEPTSPATTASKMRRRNPSAMESGSRVGWSWGQ
ncbi:MAG: serine/threonine-protein kinase [Myxococcota bacterium]